MGLFVAWLAFQAKDKDVTGGTVPANGRLRSVRFPSDTRAVVTLLLARPTHDGFCGTAKEFCSYFMPTYPMRSAAVFGGNATAKSLVRR